MEHWTSEAVAVLAVSIGIPADQIIAKATNHAGIRVRLDGDDAPHVELVRVADKWLLRVQGTRFNGSEKVRVFGQPEAAIAALLEFMRLTRAMTANVIVPPATIH